jgi:hypothetical protein
VYCLIVWKVGGLVLSRTSCYYKRGMDDDVGAVFSSLVTSL